MPLGASVLVTIACTCSCGPGVARITPARPGAHKAGAMTDWARKDWRAAECDAYATHNA